MKLVPINNGRHCVKVDEEDYQWLNDLKGWWLNSTGHVQLRKHGPKGQKMKTFMMSRLIMLPWRDEVVRHRNGDLLDMRRGNLQILHISEAREQTVAKSKQVRDAKHYYKYPSGYQVAAQRHGIKLWAWVKTEDQAKRKAAELEDELGISPRLGA